MGMVSCVVASELRSREPNSGEVEAVYAAGGVATGEVATGEVSARA
jgi:hypothetical protein